ncbi:MAG: precorrin-2 C(20)-methyltransferase, partial [Stellaceae bacterium]
SETELAARLAVADAAAILKLGANFAKVRRVVIRLGYGDRARYVERATMANQRTLPLEQIDPETVPYFSMILIPGRKWRG